MSEAPQNIENEINPRGKVLIIDVQPKVKQNALISEALFNPDKKYKEDYSNILISSIDSPDKKIEPNLEDRESKSLINLPDTVDDYIAIVITGSPYTSMFRETSDNRLFLANWKKDLIDFIKTANDHKIPMLGICFGEQIIAEALGGRVEEMKSKGGKEVWQIGWGKIKKTPDGMGDPLLKDVNDVFVAPEYHNDVVANIPDGAALLAEDEYGVQGFRVGNTWGFQFHPERGISKVEKILESKMTKEKIENDARTVDEIKQLGTEYDQSLKTIFSNFLKFAWSNKQ